MTKSEQNIRYAFLAILFLIGYSCYKACTHKAKSEVTSNEKVIKKGVMPDTAIRTFTLKFSKQINAIENISEPFEKQFNKFGKAYVHGQVDDFACYNAANQAQKACSNSYNRALSLDVPDSMPSKFKEQFSSIIEDIQTAYSVKQDCYSKLADALDNPDTKGLFKQTNELKQSMAGANYNIFDANSKIKGLLAETKLLAPKN